MSDEEDTKPVDAPHRRPYRWIGVAVFGFMAVIVTVGVVRSVWHNLWSREGENLDLALIGMSLSLWLLTYLFTRAKREGYPGQGRFSRWLGRGDGDL